MTMPEDAPRSELHVWRDAKGRRAPDRFAWLVAGGVYRGHLAPEDAEPGAADRVLDNHSLVPFPPPPMDGTLDGTLEEALLRHPLSVAATNHHVLSLFPSTAEAVNVVTGDPADPVPLARLMPLGGEDADAPHARCLATDPVTRDVYLITATAILRVTAKDEDRDAWRWHLDRGEFTLALEKCADDAQRGAVHARRAEMASRAGEHMRAAAFYAEAGAAVSFEAVCLGFLDRGEDDALALYLRRRLDVVDRERDPETAKKLANWLADLHVSRACQAEEGTPAEAEAEADLRAFVAEHARWLDPDATRKLLVEYGREDDLAFFAEVFGDWAEAVAHSLRRGDAGRAIETLSNPDVPAEEVYAAAAELFRLAPRAPSTCFSTRDRTDSIPRDSRTRSNPVWRRRRGDDRDDEDDDAPADDRDDRRRRLHRLEETRGDSVPSDGRDSSRRARPRRARPSRSFPRGRASSLARGVDAIPRRRRAKRRRRTHVRSRARGASVRNRRRDGRGDSDSNRRGSTRPRVTTRARRRRTSTPRFASRTRATADSTPIRTIPKLDARARTTIPIVPTIRILKMTTMTKTKRRVDAPDRGVVLVVAVVGARRGAARGARLLVRW